MRLRGRETDDNGICSEGRERKERIREMSGDKKSMIDRCVALRRFPDISPNAVALKDPLTWGYVDR